MSKMSVATCPHSKDGVKSDLSRQKTRECKIIGVGSAAKRVETREIKNKNVKGEWRVDSAGESIRC